MARDGIEPPTPAFSGPRSTTELPGLSADFWLHGYVWNPALPERVGGSTCSSLQQLDQYTNSQTPSQTGLRQKLAHIAFPCSTLVGNHAL